MTLEHHYAIQLAWTGNRGTGTSHYKSYGRDHVISAEGKHDIEGSSDRVFRGDVERWNPEEMLVAALSQCHLMSYLHVATAAGVVVTAYTDAATGSLVLRGNGAGHMTSATLQPAVTVASADMVEKALELHQEAAEKCFIAASVNFPVGYDPRVTAATP